MQQAICIGRHRDAPFVSVVFDPINQTDLQEDRVRLSFVSWTDRRVTCTRVMHRETARNMARTEKNLQQKAMVQSIYRDSRSYALC